MIRSSKPIPEILLTQVPLGQPRQYYPAKITVRKVLLSFGAVLLMIGLVILGYAFVVSFQRWMEYGIASIWSNLRQSGIIGLGCILIGSILVVLSIRERKITVMIYENGISIFGVKLIYNWKWSDISQIYEDRDQQFIFGLPVFSSKSIILVDNFNHSIELNGSINGFDEIVDLIKANVYPRILRETSAKFQNSQIIQFGGIFVSKQGGIIVNDQQTTWKNISKIEVVRGYLQISRIADSTKLFRIPVNKIANIEVFLALTVPQVSN